MKKLVHLRFIFLQLKIQIEWDGLGWGEVVCKAIFMSNLTTVEVDFDLLKSLYCDYEHG